MMAEVEDARGALAGVGRGRQRDGNNNERASLSITYNNDDDDDRDRETSNKQRGFYSKIFRQYLLPSSFNLNQSAGLRAGHRPAVSKGKAKLQHRRDAVGGGGDDDDDDDDDEKVNFAKESKNNADEVDCRPRQPRRPAEGLSSASASGSHLDWSCRPGERTRRELDGRETDDGQANGRSLARGSCRSNAAAAASGEWEQARETQQRRQPGQRRKVFERPEGRDLEGKIESSASKLKLLANAFTHKLNRVKTTSNAIGNDSLRLFQSFDEHFHGGARKGLHQSQSDSLETNDEDRNQTSEQSQLEQNRQRHCEQILELRRNELREQLSKFREQIQSEQADKSNQPFGRKSFLQLKRNNKPTFVQSAASNLIRFRGPTKWNPESKSSLIEQELDLNQEPDEGHKDLNNNQHQDDNLPGALLIDFELGEQTEKVCKMSKLAENSIRRDRPTPITSSASGKSARVSGERHSSLLLPLLTTLTLLLISALGPHLALGQHQSTFSRSQPGLLQAGGGSNGLNGPTSSRLGVPSLTPAQLPPSHSQPPTQSQQQQQSPQQQQTLPQQQQQPQQPSPLPATGSLVANINCNKIRGHVTMTPNLQGGTTITTQISAGPPGEVYQWSVHQFPIKPGAAMSSCSPLILGSKLIDLSELHGNLPSDQEFSVQSNVALFGPDSPVGHSLMLRGLKTGMVACGTFLPTSRKSNYRAKFHTPLSGSITIFQTAFGTSFLSHLMYSNGTRRHSQHRFDILRSEDDISLTTNSFSGVNSNNNNNNNNNNLLQSAPPPPSSSLTQHLEQREHENELQSCRRLQSVGEPLFRNLSYQLTVSTENFGMRGRTALVLPQIPFETFSSIYVVVYSELDPLEPIACAPLRFVRPKTAAAKFQTVSVQGQIVFQQDSPYDVTVARVNLNFPNSDGHSYGIDELPMIIRRKSDTRVCPNIREIIYNPHHIEPSSVPPEGEATSDQYAVGDLSGKYGSLTGKQSEKITVNDHNLPLFGPVSIIGRALTIYSADGVAIACSNVELTSPMTTAFATFDFGIQGQFIFRQQMNDCNGDTYVYIEVSKPTIASSGQSQSAAASLANGNHQLNDHHQARSQDHNWHIHANPVDSGLEHLSTSECSAAGGHFNPYNTSTSTIYSRDCTPFNVLRCELGDLSSKMFTIEIPPYKVKSGGQDPDIGKFFGTDIDLPLCGPVSIVNRSVVVHVADFGLQRLACSTVIEFKPRN